MKSYVNRRSMGIVGLLLASQLLSACIIIPRPFHRHHVIEGSAQPGYYGGPRGPYGDRRDGGRR